MSVIRKDKPGRGPRKKEKKWRRLYIYVDQYQFGEIIKAMRKHGYRALPESRVFDLMNGMP